MARTDQPHKLTFDSFVAQASDLSNPVNSKHVDLDYSRPETREGWHGRRTKVAIWCNAHAEFFVQQAGNHLNGQGCPKCGSALRTLKKTKADPVADFRRVHGDAYDYSRVAYRNAYTPVEVVCRDHGAFSVRPNAHLRGSGCPLCWQARRKSSGAQRSASFRDEFTERSAQVHGGAYTIVVSPEHAHGDAVLECRKHGEFTQKAYSHLAGHGCPTCGKSTPYAQRDLAAFIEGLGFAVGHDNTSVLLGLHIDIWLPGKGVGVEYHGQYWHTEGRVGGKHRKKWVAAEAAGIRLVQVFDFEWLEQRTIVEDRLRAILGVGPVAYARKCVVREVSAAEARVFLTKHHLAGHAPRTEVAYGLFMGEHMVACAAFGRGRFGKDSGWEILRYASEGRVQGGFSKLFKAFVRRHAPERVVSYCDLRWGDGRMYGASGFTLDGITSPDYWYTDAQGTARVSRYVAQKRPQGQTERDWAAEHDYQRVLGVGHQRWVWRRP